MDNVVSDWFEEEETDFGLAAFQEQDFGLDVLHKQDLSEKLEKKKKNPKKEPYFPKKESKKYTMFLPCDACLHKVPCDTCIDTTLASPSCDICFNNSCFKVRACLKKTKK